MTERLFHVAAVPFEAARRVSILPPGHRSRRLHGHSFLARVRAELPAGWEAVSQGSRVRHERDGGATRVTGKKAIAYTKSVRDELWRAIPNLSPELKVI